MQTVDRVRDVGQQDRVRFVVGDWHVDPAARELRRAGERIAIEPRQMAVLVALCRNPGQVLSSGALLTHCRLDEPSGDNPIHKAIAHLRRVLGDSAAAPRYIETLRKQGYRLIAPTNVVTDDGIRSHRGAWAGASPFCGLEPFDASRANVFFGRDGVVALLRDCLRLQWLRGDPLVLLLGPSGAGKTSLVQAGLLPALTMERTAVPGGGARHGDALRTSTAAFVDLGSPDDCGIWQALAGGLLDWEIDGLPLFAGYSVATLAQALSSRCEAVLRTLRANLGAPTPGMPFAPPLLVIDRLEALFQPPLAAHAEAVVDVLEALVDSGLLIVLGICRNNFHAALARHRLFMRGKPFGSHVDLEPPDAEAISQIVRLPARAAGLVYATDASGLHRLDDRLCADAMLAPYALPLLQYTLKSLYQARAPGGVITWQAYDALGGFEGVIGQRAEAVLAALPAQQQAALARLLPRLVACGTTARWMREVELAGDAEVALARALVAARLLVADNLAGVACIRIAHEALLRRWPRAATWIARHRSMLAARDELLPWLQHWEDSGRAPSLLLPDGRMLGRAADIAARAPQLFSVREHDFVVCSQQRVRRQVRLRWAAALCVAMLVLVAAGAATRNAQLARIAAQREAQSQRLASLMLNDLEGRLRPLGKLELLASIGEQGIPLLERDGHEAPSSLDALARAKALVVIGEVDAMRGRGRLPVAMAAQHEPDALPEPLRRDGGLPPGDPCKTLVAMAFWQAQIALDGGDFDEAQRQMTRYRTACGPWHDPVPQASWAAAESEAVADIRISPGEIEDLPSPPAKAWEHCNDARKLEGLLLARSPDEAVGAYPVDVAERPGGRAAPTSRPGSYGRAPAGACVVPGTADACDNNSVFRSLPALLPK